MKHTKQFKEFINERVTKYKSYIPSKFKKNSNLDLNNALDALYSLNLDEHDIMNSISRTLKEQRPDIADNFGDDLIELEGALSRVFDAIEAIKNKVDGLE